MESGLIVHHTTPPNKRIEPMTSSAVREWFQLVAVDALLVTAHPHRLPVTA